MSSLKILGKQINDNHWYGRAARSFTTFCQALNCTPFKAKLTADPPISLNLALAPPPLLKLWNRSCPGSWQTSMTGQLPLRQTQALAYQSQGNQNTPEEGRTLLQQHETGNLVRVLSGRPLYIWGEGKCLAKVVQYIQILRAGTCYSYSRRFFLQIIFVW